MKRRSRDRAMRNIYKRGGIYWFAKMVDGRRKPISLHTADAAVAIREAAKRRHAPETSDSGLLLEHCVKQFVSEMRKIRAHGSRKGWSRGTADSKIYVLQNFAAFAGNRLTPMRVTPDVIRQFYKHRLTTRNAQTAYGNYMTVRSFFNWAVEERLVDSNPCLQVKVEAPPRSARKDFAPPELVKKLIEECPSEDIRYVLYCGFHAGLRFLEIVESVPWWFDLDRGNIHLRKTPTIDFKDLDERIVPMTAAFRKFVRDEYGLREPFMLHPENDKHRKWRYRYDFSRPFKQYMKDQKCEWITPHIMRHTWMSLLASMDPKLGGPSDFEICTWAGIDLRVYQRTYAKLRPRRGAMDKAFEVHDARRRKSE